MHRMTHGPVLRASYSDADANHVVEQFVRGVAEAAEALGIDFIVVGYAQGETGVAKHGELTVPNAAEELEHLRDEYVKFAQTVCN